MVAYLGRKTIEGFVVKRLLKSLVERFADEENIYLKPVKVNPSLES